MTGAQAVAPGRDRAPGATGLASDPGHAEPQRRHAYGALIGAFSGVVLGAVSVGAARGRLALGGPSAADVALLGAAAHKLSRLVSKERVTAVVREPFVELDPERPTGGTDDERPAGTGARRAVGELLTCPSCLGLWSSGIGVAGLAWAPRVTRGVATVFAVDALSDFLHVAYRASRTRA